MLLHWPLNPLRYVPYLRWLWWQILWVYLAAHILFFLGLRGLHRIVLHLPTLPYSPSRLPLYRLRLPALWLYAHRLPFWSKYQNWQCICSTLFRLDWIYWELFP